jgi:hypothetical protein
MLKRSRTGMSSAGTVKGDITKKSTRNLKGDIRIKSTSTPIRMGMITIWQETKSY